MIRTVIAWTAEVDDPQVAVAEIKAQLDSADGMMGNSIGIVACHYEFVLSGILKAVCEAVPFDVVGTISSAQSVLNESDSLILTLMVMTSDDVLFDVVMTESLLAEPGRVISNSIKAAEKEDKPALVLAFAPFMIQNSGDEYVNVISEATGGVPCFGTLAVDDTNDFAYCFMLCNGQHYPDRMAMVMIYGDIKPKFYFANISLGKMLEPSAIVTKSEGHVLMEVNGRPVIKYFEDLGLKKASETQYAMTNLPFLLDYNDGTPRVSKVFVKLTPEEYAICAGAMPMGSTFNIAESDKNDVLLTTDEAADMIVNDIEGASGLLIYSCISRSMALGVDQYKEAELINEKIGGKVPFMMVYSGGEICPTQMSGDKASNRFHNNAFIACLF